MALNVTGNAFRVTPNTIDRLRQKRVDGKYSGKVNFRRIKKGKTFQSERVLLKESKPQINQFTSNSITYILPWVSFYQKKNI